MTLFNLNYSETKKLHRNMLHMILTVILLHYHNIIYFNRLECIDIKARLQSTNFCMHPALICTNLSTERAFLCLMFEPVKEIPVLVSLCT